MEEGRYACRVTYNVLRPEVATCHAQQGAITRGSFLPTAFVSVQQIQPKGKQTN